MKKLLIIALLIAGCKKESATVTYPTGTTFNVKGISLQSLAQLHNASQVVPQNPFTVDSLDKSDSYSSLNYYHCHSVNGNIYKMPQSNMDVISTSAAPEPDQSSK